MEETKIESNILNFLFIIQTRRRVAPLMMVFPKIGLFYAYVGANLFIFSSGYGLVTFFIYLAVGKYIYNNQMQYRYYQSHEMYFYRRFIDYLHVRKPTKSYEQIISSNYV
jgi:hypothetical protein